MLRALWSKPLAAASALLRTVPLRHNTTHSGPPLTGQTKVSGVTRNRFDLTQYGRTFDKGQVFDPRELDEQKADLSRRRDNLIPKKVRSDRFTRQGINPLNEYRDVNMLSQYVTEMGRIKHRRHTNLTNKSHRRVAKAIRRARAFGLLPVTYKVHSSYRL
ncbi:hypothetical protein H4R34_000049 [Dimargaris verticillata]|uniref:Small ribosomal subunit protein bS18m n=1 Tax=Dimargaris verticillata TaxID=2761393 RepID=A0A9W8EGA7_9FUNG|nr:hypothetical protein H4R34_000049 [Dimargaris verticillata]